MFLSLGISKFSILGQIWSEAVIIAILSIGLSFAVAPAVSQMTTEYLVEGQVQQAQEKEKMKVEWWLPIMSHQNKTYRM